MIRWFYEQFHWKSWNLFRLLDFLKIFNIFVNVKWLTEVFFTDYIGLKTIFVFVASTSIKIKFDELQTS